jgi:hypothetical protein
MGKLPAVTSVSDAPGSDPDASGPRHRLRHRSPRRSRAERKRDRQPADWSPLTIETKAPRSGRLEFEPPTLNLEDRRSEGPSMFRQRKRYVEAGTVFAALVALGTMALVGFLVYRGTRVHLTQTGITDEDVITTQEAAQMQVTIVFADAEAAAEATLSYDGEVVEAPVQDDTMFWIPPAPPVEGAHELSLAVPRALLDDAQFHWDFTVDGTAPSLEVPSAVEPVAMDDEADVSGVVEAGATLTADDDPVRLGDDGSFTLHYDRPPAGPINLEAVDEAGNVTTASVVVPVTYPGLRGVHVTAAAWGNQQLRDGILAMIDEQRIDTVQLDLKDDSGVVGFDTNVARAAEIGAMVRNYDLDTAITTLKNRGVRVVGRIVTFRDPKLAAAAWAEGQGDQVIQTPRGDPYDVSGMYTNPASAAVRGYNLDIALDAVSRGVDDILWSDTRLPTGDLESIVIPGLTGTPSDAVTRFLAEAHNELRQRGAYQGVTVEGEAAERGDLVGQDVTRIARNADYVAPEIYPGYWGNGRYGVADPRHQPADLVRGVLARYQEVTAGSGTVLVPWLQDFAVGGVDYGDAEVRAQIEAARGLGVDRFLLWSPAVRYSAGGVDPTG